MLGTDIGKMVEMVEKAEKKLRDTGKDEDEEPEEEEDEDDEEAEESRQKELDDWDKKGKAEPRKQEAPKKPAEVTVGSVPYAGYFGLETRKMGLVEFFNSHVKRDGSVPEAGGAVPYVFEKNKRVTRDGLNMLSQFVNLVFRGAETQLICPIDGGRNGAGESIHFYLGRNGSGAPTHVHADAINLLVRGWKRWFVVSWLNRRRGSVITLSNTSRTRCLIPI
jgi:hypothetical protein